MIAILLWALGAFLAVSILIALALGSAPEKVRKKLKSK